MSVRLLIVDPDAGQRPLYREALPAQEYQLRFEARGERGIECAFDWRPDAVILETRLTGIQGLEVCRLLKSDARTRAVPVLFVAAAATQAELIEGLKLGADHFMAKPFHPVELLWRLKGLLRRYQASAVDSQPLLRAGPLDLDAEQGVCTLDGRTLRLTPKEFALLEAFLRRPGRVLKRRFLLETVWGFDPDIRTRVVDLTLFRLRRKLGSVGKLFETLPGFGYRLNSR